MPLTQEEYADFQDRAGKLVARLRENAVIPESMPMADFRAAVNGLIEALNARKGLFPVIRESRLEPLADVG
jgi:hypothetical protein